MLLLLSISSVARFSQSLHDASLDHATLLLTRRQSDFFPRCSQHQMLTLVALAASCCQIYFISGAFCIHSLCAELIHNIRTHIGGILFHIDTCRHTKLSLNILTGNLEKLAGIAMYNLSQINCAYQKQLIAHILLIFV